MACKKMSIVASLTCLLLFANFTYGHAEEVLVLVYHNVVNSTTPEPGRFDQISLMLFKEQMRYLYEIGYETISIDQLVSFMKGGAVPRKSIVLAFDDGWKSI